MSEPNEEADHAYDSNGASRDPSCSECGRESYEHASEKDADGPGAPHVGPDNSDR